MALTAAQIHGFSQGLLQRNYDNPMTTPPFHAELWEMFCSDHPQVAAAAPRGHAKSTAITHAFTLASVLFRERRFVVIVSNTEAQSVNFLGDIKNELAENEDLRELFGVRRFLKETETEVVCQLDDGHTFRIVAKGSEQKLRGLKWRNKRPDLVVGDDLEDDEQIASKDRREKFRKWFFGALVPALSKNGIIRVVGTVMHMDSLLERLLNNRAWLSRRYAAHGPGYRDILWPELWPKERLEAKRQEYLDEGFPEGYSQEYLNNPIDENTAFFKKDDLIPIKEKDKDEHLTYYAAADFAITDGDRSDYTVILVAGVNSAGKVRVVDVRRGRWDSFMIIEEMFSVQRRFSPDIFTVERGAIEKSLGPFLYAEMNKTGVYLNLNPLTPTKDKQSRARSIQARMRAGGVEFDTEAEWWPELQSEILRFPRDKHDDQVDALAWIGLTLDKLVEAPTQQEMEEEEYEAEFGDFFYGQGRSAYAGY